MSKTALKFRPPVTRQTGRPSVRQPTPAKDLLATFWKLEKEAEKMLEGLANAK